MPDGSNTGGIAAARLLSIVERVERLEEEKRALAEDIKDVYQEAKSAGFDAPTIRALVKERRLSVADRQEREALLQLYRGALGMLGGTPLGEAAISRLMKPPAPPEEDPGPPLPGMAPPAEAAPAAPAPPTPDEIAAAKDAGAEAAKAGKPVLANPWGAGDARRAAWDEGWCSATGSDGMDIPAAFRRSTPKKPKKPGKGGEG